MGRKRKWTSKEYTFKQMYDKIIKRHNTRDCDGQVISFDTYCNLTHSKCKYCGEQHSNCVKDKKHDIYYQYNGIDRLDSSVGYTQENCVPCCKTCNCAKLCMSEEQFHEWIKRVYRYNNGFLAACPSKVGHYLTIIGNMLKI